MDAADRARGGTAPWKVTVFLVAAAVAGGAAAWWLRTHQRNPLHETAPARRATATRADRATVELTPAEARDVEALRALLDAPRTALPDTADEALARAVLDALYARAALAEVAQAVAWSAPGCHVGPFACSELSTPAQRLAAFMSFVPLDRLTPRPVVRSAFDERVAPSLRRLLAAPDRALPCIPGRNEALYEFRDHRGLPRYLLLREDGGRWKLVAVGREDQVRQSCRAGAMR